MTSSEKPGVNQPERSGYEPLPPELSDHIEGTKRLVWPFLRVQPPEGGYEKTPAKVRLAQFLANMEVQHPPCIGVSSIANIRKLATTDTDRIIAPYINALGITVPDNPADQVGGLAFGLNVAKLLRAGNADEFERLATSAFAQDPEQWMRSISNGNTKLDLHDFPLDPNFFLWQVEGRVDSDADPIADAVNWVCFKALQRSLQFDESRHLTTDEVASHLGDVAAVPLEHLISAAEAVIRVVTDTYLFAPGSIALARAASYLLQQK